MQSTGICNLSKSDKSEYPNPPHKPYFLYNINPHLFTMSLPKPEKELPKQARLDLAIAEYQEALVAYQDLLDPRNKWPYVELIALKYGLVASTLGRRLAGKTRAHQEAYTDEQRLTPVRVAVLEVVEDDAGVEDMRVSRSGRIIRPKSDDFDNQSTI